MVKLEQIVLGMSVTLGIIFVPIGFLFYDSPIIASMLFIDALPFTGVIMSVYLSLVFILVFKSMGVKNIEIH